MPSVSCDDKVATLIKTTTSCCSWFLALSDIAGTYYLNGRWTVSPSTEIEVGGALWSYVRNKDHQERLSTSGPIKEPLILGVQSTLTILYINSEVSGCILIFRFCLFFFFSVSSSQRLHIPHQLQVLLAPRCQCWCLSWGGIPLASWSMEKLQQSMWKGYFCLF